MSDEKIVSYKGFDKDLKCRDFQYEIGKTYTHEGKVKACDEGFHACEYPLDVFNYYAPNESKFAVAEQSGDLSREGSDTKVASRTITIKAGIDIPGLIRAAIEYTVTRCEPANAQHATGYQSASASTGDRSASASTGDQSASASTGDQSASASTGYRSASASTGYQSASASTGDRSASASTGNRSASASTGDQSASASTGDRSASASTGYQSASASTGYRSASASTGYQSASASTGDRSASASTGDRSASASTGDQSASASTGYQSASASTGNQSASASTGYRSASASTGDRSSSEIIPHKENKPLHAVACALGEGSKARAPDGSAIVCVFRNDDGDLIHIRASKVGENGIKPNVWYSLNAEGEFVEAV